MSNYGFNITVEGDFEEISARVTAALKAEGFGVLTTINAHTTLKEKIGVDMLPYRILGACNPPLAHQAITQEADIGLLLPCNVLVRADADGKVTVAFMDPESVLGMVQRPELGALGAEVKQRLLRVKDALAG